VSDLPVIEICPRNGLLMSTLTSAVEAEASLTIVIWLLVEVLENELRGQRSLSDENQSRKSITVIDPPLKGASTGWIFYKY